MIYNSSFFTSPIGLFIVLILGLFSLYFLHKKHDKFNYIDIKLLVSSIGFIIYFIIVVILKYLGKVQQ